MASQMEPGEARVVVEIGPGGVQDCLGIVLVRSFFRLAVWVRFFEPLGCLLGSFWGVSGLVLGHLGLVWASFGSSWARFWPLRVAFWSPMRLYAHQIISSSTLQPMACQHFATRASGLRAARLNPPPPEGSEHVRLVFENVFRIIRTQKV